MKHQERLALISDGETPTDKEILRARDALMSDYHSRMIVFH